MGVWSDIGGAICVAVTALGLVWSYRIWRKDGVHRGMRAIAWSLIPLAAYLVGAVGLIGRLVNAVVIFAGSLVFSPKTYAGVIVVHRGRPAVPPLRRAAAGQGAKGPQAPQGGEGRGAGAAGLGQPAAATGRETKAVEPRKHKARRTAAARAMTT